MAKIMISELSEATTVLDSDYVAIDNGTATKKITVANYNNTANHTAKSYAEQAGTYASNAHDSELAAKAAKDEAVLQVSAAATQVGYAETYASNASTSATSASNSASTASTKAANAESSANAAAASAAEVENEALLSKSWAVGNTGVRPGENTDNSKYWASVAQAIAGGGVISFNGRGGAVIPVAGDYNTAQINHTKGSSTIPLSTELSSIQSEITGVQSEINVVKGEVQTATLTAGSTTLTFTVTSLTANSLIDVYASVYGIAPTNITVSGTTLTLTFDEMENDVSIKVHVH